MHRLILLLCILVTSFLPALAQNTDAVTSFLETLNSEERDKLQMPFDSDSRVTWHFLPTAMWPRPGIQLGELHQGQRSAFFEMLKAYLSESGYQKVEDILWLESFLADLESNPDFRDAGKYVIAIYGEPAKDSLWAWSFEGHHISVNFTVVNDRVECAPRFYGANPARVESGPHRGRRTLQREEDLGLAFMNSLDPGQQVVAVISDKPFADIVTTNKSEVDPLESKGIDMRHLSDIQQELLWELIQEYLSSIPEHLAQERTDRIMEEDLEHISFAWAGPVSSEKEPYYYRVQGKTFLLEFDNAIGGGNHIHTVWREFNGDFGRDLIREHHQQHDHDHK